jgi:rhamnulokinase
LVNHLGIEPIKVIITASHDTASAVAAIPVQDENFAYISSGTWSLVGMEVDRPIINKESLAMNFTIEAGAENRFLHMKNLTGLWLLQECQRHWEKIGNEMDFLALIKMAEQARPFIAHIHPNDRFYLTRDVPIVKQGMFRNRTETPHTQGDSFGVS